MVAGQTEIYPGFVRLETLVMEIDNYYFHSVPKMRWAVAYVFRPIVQAIGYPDYWVVLNP